MLKAVIRQITLVLKIVSRLCQKIKHFHPFAAQSARNMLKNRADVSARALLKRLLEPQHRLFLDAGNITPGNIQLLG